MLLKRQNGLCALCKKVSARYEIDHVVYNPMITLDHIRLICRPCHRSITDFTTFKNKNMALLRGVNTSQIIDFATHVANTIQ